MKTLDEIIIYNYIRKNTEFFIIVNDRFFDNDDVRECYRINKKFFDKYNEIPSIKIIAEQLRQNEIESFLIKEDNDLEDIFYINKEKLENIHNEELLEDIDNDEWVREHFEKWIQMKTLESSGMEFVKLLKSVTVKDDINEVIEKAKAIINDKNNINIVVDLGLDGYNPDSYFQNPEDTFPTGYPWLDKVIGGWLKGTLNIFVAGTGVGKSTALVNLASKVIESGKNTAYVSNELSEKQLAKKFAVNLFNITMREYFEYSQDPEKMRIEIEDFLTKQRGRYFIKKYSNGSTTVAEIKNYLLGIEKKEGIKLEVVVVDYISNIRAAKGLKTENSYEREAGIAKELIAMAEENDWVVLSAIQYNRTGIVKPGIENISNSMGVPFVASNVFSLEQKKTENLEEDRQPVMIDKIEDFANLPMPGNNSGTTTIIRAIKLRDSEWQNDFKTFNFDYQHQRLVEKL
jgi:hypothetical protein